MPRKHTFDLDAYPFTVRRMAEDEGEGYVAEYPDVPYCAGDGKTPQEAVKNGREALEAGLMALTELGKPIPKPAWNASSGQWKQRAPKSLHAQLTHRAQMEGVSLNTLVITLLAEGLGRRMEDRPR